MSYDVFEEAVSVYLDNEFLFNCNSFLFFSLPSRTHSWMRLCYTVDAKGNIPIKVIAKTFASGKTEKLVYQSLAEIELPGDKTATIEKDEFTFDKFYKLYHKVCPRNDIEELFETM